jgi:hypothetical protein
VDFPFGKPTIIFSISMNNYGGECGITISKLYYDLKKNAELDQKFQEGKSFPFRFCSELHLLPQDSRKKFHASQRWRANGKWVCVKMRYS